ncbi:unnamed protein product, partial [Rotaria magnacalcarata]
IWNLMPQGATALKILIQKIKEESLRIYLFSNAMIFYSISVPNLEDMFQLPIERGSIKESSQTIILSKARSSKIQNLSIELMEKICRLNEQNEKLTHFYSRQRQQLLN